MTRYSPEAVNASIASSNRHGRKIGGREAKLIHRLLAGRTPAIADVEFRDKPYDSDGWNARQDRDTKR